ncbi:MAG: DUF1648 domain-containing protein [Chitinophagaceae bacterium]|nr:DUF1648 domain-containing protein [Chitinophagaceae bacterium]
MNRPKISVPFTKTDSRLELVIWLLSAAVLASVLYHYVVLPERVPIHFSFNGQPDSWSGKDSVWLLAGIYFLIGSLLFWLNKRPQLFNYSVTITPDNAAAIYQMGSRMMRLLRLWLALIFLSVQWMIYEKTFTSDTNYLSYVLIACLVGSLSTVVWGIYRFHIKAPK